MRLTLCVADPFS